MDDYFTNLFQVIYGTAGSIDEEQRILYDIIC